MVRRTGLLTLIGACLALGPVPSSAQIAVKTAEKPDSMQLEVEVERKAVELEDAIRTHPIDRDTVHTALVFHNTRGDTALVHCTGFDYNGRAVGRARMKVPGNGLRFIWASDLSYGRDFVGTATCSSSGHVNGSAYLLGPTGLSDLNVAQSDGRGATIIRFSPIATY